MAGWFIVCFQLWKHWQVWRTQEILGVAGEYLSNGVVGWTGLSFDFWNNVFHLSKLDWTLSFNRILLSLGILNVSKLEEFDASLSKLDVCRTATKSHAFWLVNFFVLVSVLSGILGLQTKMCQKQCLYIHIFYIYALAHQKKQYIF